MSKMKFLTERQKRELEYHQKHAELNKSILEKPFSFEVVTSGIRKWWNAHWEMYAYLMEKNLKDKRVLVIGCGFGSDALYLSKCGANVSAFDISSDSLDIAKKLSEREGLNVDFKNIPAETLSYKDNYFDVVVARDILHHVDIEKSIEEIARVSKPGAIFCFNEVVVIPAC